MSWIDNLQEQFRIVTGDGLVHLPFWVPTRKEIEFNTVEFEFIDKNGALVRRDTKKADRYPLDFAFMGEFHLQEASRFENSLLDKRPLQVDHPYHGTLLVQPTSISRDDSQYNATRYTGTFIVTISEENPQFTKNPNDTINEDASNVNENLNSAFDEQISPDDLNKLNARNARAYANGIKKAGSSADDYYNAFNTANAAVLDATNEPLAAMRATQALINAPALFAQSVKDRFELFDDQFSVLKTIIASNPERSSKKIYEHNGGSIMVGYILSASTPAATDYKRNKDVFDTIDKMVEKFEEYLTDLDQIQTENGGDPDSYIPDATALINLSRLMNFTIANLRTIALGAKLERSIITDKDENIISLAYKFYGIDDNDESINELIENNEFGLNDMISIKKGTKVIYYI